jgi:hypothetical protein
MEYKEAPDKYASSPKGLQRLTKLKWWYIVLLIIGLAVAIKVFVWTIEPASVELRNLVFFLITPAFAETTMPTGPFDPKPIVIMAIIAALLIVLLGSVWTMLHSSNASTIQAAGDLSKVLVGFFVGVATKFLGT